MTTRFVATQWVGTGTRTDPYLPDVDLDPTLVSGWGVVDLRDDATQTVGYCIAAVDYFTGSPAPVKADGSTGFGFFDLGAQVDVVLSQGASNNIADAIGVARQGRATMGQLMLTKLGPFLQPVDGRWRIQINGQTFLDQPVVAGGATDSFTYSNGVLGSVSSSAWTDVLNSHTVTSNALAVGTANNDRYSVWATAMGSTDHYAELDCGAVVSGGFKTIGPTCRGSNSAFTCYWSRFYGQNGGTYNLARMSAGSYTSLASSTSVGLTARRIGVRASGSTIKLFADTVEQLSVTDTNLTGSYVGVASYEQNVASAVTGDSWTGDVTATVPAAVTDLSGTAGNTQVPLTWTAPADGGAALTDYVVQYRPV